MPKGTTPQSNLCHPPDPPGSRRNSTTSQMSVNSVNSTDSVVEPSRKRGRNSRKSSVSIPSVSQSNNIYKILQDNVQVPETSSARNTGVATKPSENKTKVPQFVIYNRKLVNIYELLDTVIPNCQNAYGSYIKLSRHGTKIFVENNDQYRKLRSVCNEKGIYYHCHPLSDELLDKFVIYGLHADTPITLIETALARVGVSPHAVVNLNVKKPRWDGHATFQVQFKRTDKVTLEQLQEIRAISFLKVRFERYRGRGLVTLCPNCLNPGHGSTGCGLPARCIRCGQDHKSTECPERTDKADPKSHIPNEKVKCANCGEKHPANYRGC